MHSWRALLLPYLEQHALHNAYDFDEPWNSPHNRKLADQVPKLFQCPLYAKTGGTHVSYLAVTGPGTAWPDEGEFSVGSAADGVSSVLMLVEVADSGIDWLEPRDVRLDDLLAEGNPAIQVPSSKHRIPGNYLFRSRPSAGLVTFTDNHLVGFSKPLSRNNLKALATANGGETIDWDDIDAPDDRPLLARLRWDHVMGLPLFILSLAWFWRRMAMDERMGEVKAPDSDER
jgi:hypothetical protein